MSRSLHKMPVASDGQLVGVGPSLPNVIKTIQQTVVLGDFTDGGSTTGTVDLTDQLPANALVLGCLVKVNAAFAGDTSATLQVGDGSDVDRYSTGTPSVFAAAPNGINMGAVSGVAHQTQADTVTLTVTSATDFTSVTGGSLSITILYIQH